MPRLGWSAPLTRSIQVKDGTTLRTLNDARAYMLDHLPEADPSKMDFGKKEKEDGAKAWKDIWGCGQGIANIKAVEPVARVVDRLESEYRAARSRLSL